MGCMNSSPRPDDPDALKQQQEANKKINEQIKRDRRRFKATHRLLLLGAGESGKSTIVKQMKLLHVDGFSEDERIAKVIDIRNNVRESICAILSAMPNLGIPLQKAENEALADFVKGIQRVHSYDYPQDFFDHVAGLWQDTGVKTAFERSHEYQLIDCAEYFLNKVAEVRKDDYRPTDEDILRCRVQTRGVFETKFIVNNVRFHMFDVGGQREERPKWIQCFTGVTAIMFVASCSSYNMTLREDPSKYRLVEALELFNSIWNNEWLQDSSVILFLNKEDVLREKVNAGRSPISKYYPDYANFRPDESAYKALVPNDGDETAEVRKAKLFFAETFLRCTKTADQRTKEHSERRPRECFLHFTTAIDTENINRVFNDCRNIILRWHLENYDLM